jgi:hypothetical protein
MKAVTAFFVVFALVMFMVSPAFAAKGASAAQPQTVVREAVEIQSTAPEGEAAPLPVRSQSTGLLLPIPPGVYTVGAAGAYPTISAAVSALQTSGVAGGGTVIFRLIDPLYSDTGQTIGAYAGQGIGAPVVFDVAPGVLARIKFTGGTVASNSFGFRLDNANSVTIDGFGIGPSGRSLTIDCDTATTVSRNGIVIQRASKNIQVKNTIILGNRRAASTSFGAVRIVNTGFFALGGQTDILIENNHLLRASDGVQLIAAGTATLVLDTNITIRGNLIGGAGSASYLDNLSGNGVTLQGAVNSLVENNDIYGIKATGPIGITPTGGCVNVTVRNNKIHDLVVVSGTSRPAGMNFHGGLVNSGQTKSVIYAYNNLVYDLHNYGTLGARAYRGICLGVFAGNFATVYLYNNTVNIVTAAGEAGGPGGPTGFAVDFNGFGAGGVALPDTVYMYNNIFSQKRATDFSRTYLMFTSTTMGVHADNNLFYQPDGGAFAQWPTPFPTGAAFVGTQAQWGTDTGNDLVSKVGDPLFVGALDNHINVAVGSVSPADSMGTPVALVPTDYDGDVRNAVKPDAGADEFTVTRYTNDIAAQSVDYPTPTLIMAAGNPFSPKATFKNPGSVSQASVPVKVEIFNSVPALVYTGTATIAVGGYDNTAQATFTPTASLAAGSYTITATAMLPGDLNAADDAVTSSLFVQASVSSLPYTEGFEAGPNGWLTTSPGGANDWVIATPKKAQLSHAYAGTKAWITKDTLNYADNQESYVNAPILNLTTFSGVLLVQFYSNFKTEFNFDGGDLEISLDNGLSWTKVDSTLGTGTNFNTPTSTAWYNDADAQGNISAPYWDGGEGGGVSSAGYATQTDGWVLSSTALAGLSGLSDVRFRWHFSSDGGVNSEGWALDQVTFKEVLPNDIAMGSLGIPGYVGGPVPEKVSTPEPIVKSRSGQSDPVIESATSLGAVAALPVTFDAVVRNAGVLPQPAFNVGWDIDAVPQAPVANTGTLPFGSTQTLPLLWATPTTGFHSVRAWTLLGTDINPTNDSASFNFEVLAPEVVFYEGFNGTTFPPTGWDTLNVDGNTGSVTSWYRSTGAPKEGLASARANYNGANGFYIDEWLITPNTGGLLDVSYAVDSLTFYAKNFTGSIYPESLMVMISTTTADEDQFTLVLGYFEVPSSGYQKYTFALPEAANRYIAFRRLLYDGGPSGNSSDNMYIDDVRITRYAFANTFSATPGSLNFGLVPLGYTLTQTVKVKNVGNLPLNLSSVTPSDLVNYGWSGTLGTLASGESTDVTIAFHPTTFGVKNADIVFVHDGDSTPDTVTVTGAGTDALEFLTVVPDTIIAKDPVKGKLLKPVKRVKPGKPIVGPNWANLLDETVAQGGFRPGATESDSAGGMVVGVSFMTRNSPDPLNPKWKPTKDSAAVHAWVRLTKWDFKKSLGKSFNALQKTLEDKTGKHDLFPARGFDFTTDGKNKPILKQLTSLTPKKQDNPLYAHLVALKLNIAASALGKTPAGFGDLIFDRDISMFDEKTVMQIADEVDQMMTFWQLSTPADFADAYQTVSDLNKACVGPLDTVSFMTPDSLHPAGRLLLRGQVNLATIPYLKAPAVFVATRMLPTTTEVESGEDFGDEIDEVEGELPVAARLYQNYPNPFNPSTTIAFRLREESKVSIRIFNLLGQQVATLVDGEELEEGVQTVQFAATNLASGLYFYQIDAQGLGDDAMKTIETRKMLLVK